MELTKYKDLEHPIPIKAIPEDKLNAILIGQFSEWISNLLSLTDRQSMERLEYALPSIKELCWSMGLNEIKKMFEMYADGKLNIEPRSNYFNRILVGSIFKAYKEIKPIKHKKETVEISDDEKAKNAYMNIIISFDNYKQQMIMDRSDWVVYDELVSRGILKPSRKQKKTVYKNIRKNYTDLTIGGAVNKSKTVILEGYYQELIERNEHIKKHL